MPRVDANTDYVVVGLPSRDWDEEPPAGFNGGDDPDPDDPDDPEDPEDPDDPDGEEEENGEDEYELESPDQWPGEEPTAQPRARAGAQSRMAYETSIRRADALMIPRLTLDRFLNFVGIEPGRDAAARMGAP